MERRRRGVDLRPGNWVRPPGVKGLYRVITVVDGIPGHVDLALRRVGHLSGEIRHTLPVDTLVELV